MLIKSKIKKFLIPQDDCQLGVKYNNVSKPRMTADLIYFDNFLKTIAK